MTSGHTDRATINQRRPLTNNMRECLDLIRIGDESAVRRGWMGHLVPGEMTTALKNAARALMDRSMVDFHPLGYWTLTDAGRAALAESSSPIAPNASKA